VWVLRDVPCRTRWLRQTVRAVVPIVPPAAVVSVVLSDLGFGWVVFGGVACGVLLALWYSLAYIDQTGDRRLVKHGYDPGALKRVLRERNRDEHADEIARYMHVSKDCRVGCPGRTIISGGREGADVGEAREVRDRVTDAILRRDLEALKGLYAQDAVAETPDQGTITGRDQIAAYLAEFGTAFPDAAWEERSKHEGGDTAIDEGTFVGTNTGSMTGPNGETIPATGRSVRIRECDVATVANGVVTSHLFYFDVQDWATQLGLAPESPA
jgi:ketosteroid isomerase-like protein